MGLIQSILCSFTFCVERILTWTFCALLLVLLMFSLVVLMAYGITVGYHFAQKELALFAAESLTTTKVPPAERRAGGGGGAPDPQPVVRLVAVNGTREGHDMQPLLDTYRPSKSKENIYLEPDYVTPPQLPELSANEREVAKKIIGRFRRSKR